jgi:nucleoside phosphorylase
MHADIAILTVKPEEFQAVLDQFGIYSTSVQYGERDYVCKSIPLEDGTAIDVAITRCPTQGNGVSQDVTRSIINDLDPQWILLVGIAGGIPNTEFCLGDVVLARSVVDFTVERVAAGDLSEFDSEGLQAHPDVENFVAIVQAWKAKLGDWNDITVSGASGRTSLPYPPVDFNSPRLYGPPDWQNKVKQCLAAFSSRDPQTPCAFPVKLASSDKLIKDTAPIEVLLGAFRKIQAVEMEAAGVYIAARGRGGSRPSYPVLAIRGISDIVGLVRDERWTNYACHAAAAFAAAFVRCGRVGPRQKKTTQSIR